MCNIVIFNILQNNYNYPHIVTYTGTIKAKGRVGIISHTNTKYKGVVNMRYWLNEAKAITVRDENLVKELKTFVRHANGTWGHIKVDGVHDDRVVGLMWATFILNEDLVDRYFVVNETSSNGKPMIIEPLYQVAGSMTSFDDGQAAATLPVSFGTRTLDDSISDSIDGMEELSQQGWKLL